MLSKSINNHHSSTHWYVILLIYFLIGFKKATIHSNLIFKPPG
jgi:hypothetical protein